MNKHGKWTAVLHLLKGGGGFRAKEHTWWKPKEAPPLNIALLSKSVQRDNVADVGREEERGLRFIGHRDST